ncbi:MAG: hypothetical protein AB1631_30975 [Acidobacteriota bacterium]
MPLKPQNKRNFQVTYAGLTRKCEAFDGGDEKRLEAAKDVVMAGSNEVQKLHDPAYTVEAITLRLVCTRDDSFGREILNLYRQQLKNPGAAPACILQSLEDDLSVIGDKAYTQAVIQSVKPPQGDRGSSDQVMIEFVVQPQGVPAA